MKNLITCLAILGLISMSAGCGGGSESAQMTEAQWKSIVQFGMTEEEVNAAVGRPPDGMFDIVGQDSSYAWEFGYDGGTVHYNAEGRVDRIGWLINQYRPL